MTDPIPEPDVFDEDAELDTLEEGTEPFPTEPPTEA